MLFESNVSIGIAGENGSEAAFKSDISIKYFKDVKSLLVYHGTNFNIIVSMILHSVIFTLTLLGINLFVFNLLYQYSFYTLFTYVNQTFSSYFYIFTYIFISYYYLCFEKNEIFDYS